MPSQNLTLSEKRINLIIYTLLLILPITGMEVDLITPSLPSIATGLKISSDLAKGIISIYLLGYALGNFLTGLLTDSVGRQNLLRSSLLIHAVICVLPIIFPQITILLITRFVQGIAIGATVILVRVIFADIINQERIIRLGVVTGTMWAIGPVFGPVIGGYLQFYFGWQSCFYFFIAITIISLIAVIFIVPETIKQKRKLNLKTIGSDISQVITHKTFMAFPVMMAITYSLIIVFHNSGPFLVEDVLGYSPVVFGHISLYMGLSFMLATFLCKFLISRRSINSLYFNTIVISIIIATIGVILSYFMDKNINLFVVISIVMFFISGFLYPMSVGKGTSIFNNKAGIATAIMYLVNISLTSLISFLVSFINGKTTTPIMWLYLTLVISCGIIYFSILRKGLNNKKQNE